MVLSTGPRKWSLQSTTPTSRESHTTRVKFQKTRKSKLHLTLQVLQAKTKNAVDILETSFILKKTRFVSGEGEMPVQGGRDPKDVEPVKNFFSLFW